MLPCGIALHGANGAEAEVAADLDVCQLVAACGQRGVQKRGEAHAGGIIHPVAASDDPDGLFRCAQLIPVALIDALHSESTSVNPELSLCCSDYTISVRAFPQETQKTPRWSASPQEGASRKRSPALKNKKPARSLRPRRFCGLDLGGKIRCPVVRRTRKLGRTGRDFSHQVFSSKDGLFIFL